MKKVLFFIESLAGGGAEKVLSTIVKHLDKQSYSITVMTVTKTGVYVEEVEKYAKIISLLPHYSPTSNILDRIKYHLAYKEIYHSSPERIYKKYVKDLYDVEVAFVEGFATKFIAASTNPNSRKICWVHIDMEKNPYADLSYDSIAEERKTYLKYDSIVGVSNSVKAAFERKFDLHDRVTVIYNPIDCEEIRQKAVNATVVLEKGKVNLVAVGRLEDQKGFDRLIHAIRNCKASTNMHLYILGEGSKRSQLEAMIKEFGLTRHITLVGFKNNPYPWINACDALICTSRAEGYSLVIAEAMVLGKPVASVDCAGPNELLDFGKYGLLFPNTDDSIEATINTFASGAFDYEKFSMLSRTRSTFFDIVTIMQQIDQILSTSF